MQGPGVFLAQFIGDQYPYDRLDTLLEHFASLGYLGVQVPVWDRRVFDLDAASASPDYCAEYAGGFREAGMTIIELAAYLQGQVMAIHPAYAELFSGFHPRGLQGKQCVEWATAQLKKTIMASHHLGTANISVLSGGLAWPYMYPWPKRHPGLLEEAFTELARRWRPVLDMAADYGITIGFELHPGSDLHDGATLLRFLEKTGMHPAACITYDPSHFLLQRLDYLDFIRVFADRITGFHVKDAELCPTGRRGAYGGFSSWLYRCGRFRHPGDGQVDFKQVFSLLTQYGYTGWAVLEWECCLKDPGQGAAEGAEFIRRHIIRTAGHPNTGQPIYLPGLLSTKG